MLDISTPGFGKRVILDPCETCKNNGLGADKCKLNKDGSCNFEQIDNIDQVIGPRCRTCAYSTEKKDMMRKSVSYECSIGKFFGECDAYVPRDPEDKYSFKVDILGNTWTVKTATESMEPRLQGCDAFTDWTEKLMCFETGVHGNIGDMKKYLRKLVRHEVIHAFLFESGLGDSMEHREFGHEETTVDWFAYHADRICEVAGEVYARLEKIYADRKRN